MGVSTWTSCLSLAGETNGSSEQGAESADKLLNQKKEVRRMATTLLTNQVKKDARILAKAKDINNKAKANPRYRLALKLEQNRGKVKSASRRKG